MRRTIAAMTLWALIVWPNIAKADLFTIAKPQFSVSVSTDGSYSVIGPIADGTISRKNLDQGRLFFSVTIVAEDRAVDYLRAKGQLDLYAVIFGDGIRRDTVPFGITPQRWFEIGNTLTQKYNSDGLFTFRTFMYTQQTQFTSIEILLRDGDDNTVGRFSVRVVP